MQRLATILVAVGAVALIALFFTRGPKPRLEGEITRVRTLKVEERASVALVNFKARNITKHPFVAQRREMEIIAPDGGRRFGKVVQGPDLKDLFKYFPQLGGMQDEPFLFQARIEAGETARGLIAARFEVPEEDLKARRNLILRFVDGANRATEIAEKPQ